MTETETLERSRPETATATGGERKRGIDRVIILLEALLRQRAPMRVGDIARRIGAPRSTTYEIVNRLLEADMLETVGT
ncbi:MAG TPA: helix-turn-helix domain-containing protein, partial [Kaistia sp.]|nr:helix-turn-helix domain-containing protein [Kaistia sp.]